MLTQAGDDVVLTFTRRFNHPAEKVWRAVTEEEHLAAWFPQKIKGEWRAGAPLRFESDGGDGFEGEVVAFDPPSMLEIMWGTDRLRIEVRPDGNGAVLTLIDTFVELGKAARDGAGGTSASTASSTTSTAPRLASGGLTGWRSSSATSKPSGPTPRRSVRPKAGSPRRSRIDDGPPIPRLPRYGPRPPRLPPSGVLQRGAQHGYSIIAALHERSDGEFDMPEGTVYPALHKLEAAGFVASVWSTEGGRKRRIYSLTAAGRRL